MADMVVVTVMTQDERHAWDMELPAGLPMAELCPLLQTAFANTAEAPRGTGLALRYQDRQLAENETLAENGIWDGSYLKMEEI